MNKGSIKIVAQLPDKKISGDISCLVPKEKQTLAEFQYPLKLCIRSTGDTAKASASNHTQRVYVDSLYRENIDPLISQMRILLPSFCNCLFSLFKEDSLQLLYVANTQGCGDFLSSVLGHIAFEELENYYISEIQCIDKICTETHARFCAAWPVNMSFDFLGESSFPGDLILAGLIVDKKIEQKALMEIMRTDLLDKDTLNSLLGKEMVKAFWFCDTDYDGLTIWHKNLTGKDLFALFGDIIDETDPAIR